MLGVSSGTEGPMPSKSQDVGGTRLSWALNDSLRSQIGVLVASRQSMYEGVRVHHRGGQVIPTSVCDALNENALLLRDALDRYVDTTTRR